MTQEEIQNFVSEGIADIARLQKRIADVAESIQRADTQALLAFAGGVGGDPFGEIEKAGTPLRDGAVGLCRLSTELLHSVSITVGFILGVRTQRDEEVS